LSTRQMTEVKAAAKKLSADQLLSGRLSASEIERVRAQAKARGPLIRDPKGVYGVVCPACTKPNALAATFCTGCSFPCCEWDIQRLPDNVFLLMIQGQDIGTKVLYRDKNILIFDDKFGVSDNHICVIPIQVYTDITELNGSHVELLKTLYEAGKKELMSRNIGFLNGLSSNEIDELLSCGYNYPVSVRHLHIHMVLPPFKHNKVLQYPRWHSHAKVINDLKLYGTVRIYKDHPNDAQGLAEYQRAMNNQIKVLAIISALQPNPTDITTGTNGSNRQIKEK